MGDGIMGAIIAFVVTCIFALGWVVSATTIGDECDKMGGFYVGQKVYECKLRGEKE